MDFDKKSEVDDVVVIKLLFVVEFAVVGPINFAMECFFLISTSLLTLLFRSNALKNLPTMVDSSQGPPKPSNCVAMHEGTTSTAHGVS